MPSYPQNAANSPSLPGFSKFWNSTWIQIPIGPLTNDMHWLGLIRKRSQTTVLICEMKHKLQVWVAAWHGIYEHRLWRKSVQVPILAPPCMPMWPRASYVPSTCLSFFICRKEMVTVKRCSMIMRTNRDNIGEAFGKLVHRKFSGIIFYMHFILFCITVPGVPKITLKFGNLLEGPAELRKDVLLTVSLLQQKNTDENMTALSQWSLIVPATTCDNAHDILPTMAARLSLGVTSFCWGGQACRHGHPSWMTWATQPPGPNRGQTGKVRHTAPGKQKQAFAQNHIF